VLADSRTGHAHFDEAEQVMEAFRTKANADTAIEVLTKVEETIGGEEGALLTTDIALQSLLQIGSKSFSHFLNMLERYLPVLRTVTSTAARRQKALASIASFCGGNHLFVQIITDKLMRYRILDPIDVVRWILSSSPAFLSVNQWETLSSTLDLLTTRVNGLTIRVETETAENEAGACRHAALILVTCYSCRGGQGRPEPNPNPACCFAKRAQDCFGGHSERSTGSHKERGRAPRRIVVERRLAEGFCAPSKFPLLRDCAV
jgi:hypothetical protein